LGDTFRIEGCPIDDQEYMDEWFAQTVQEL